MPTTAKSTAQYATLGDLSTYSVSTTAIPIDVSDSAGSIPVVSTTFTDGTDVDYLIGEDFTLSSPSVGKYDGTIVNVAKSANSSRYSMDIHNIMARLNTEHRLFPLSDYTGYPSVWLPVAGLEYYSQQCGIFMTKVDGEPLFFQSQYNHFGAWGKDIFRMLKSGIFLYSGSESFGGAINLGRVMHKIPRDSEAFMTFPGKTYLSDLGGYLPVLIPSSTSGEVMVLGNTVRIDGTGRQVEFSYRFLDSRGNKRNILIHMDAATGFTLYTSENGTTYTNRGSVSAPNGDYTVYLGMTTSATATNYTMRVVKPDNSVVGTRTVSVTGSGLRGSLSLTQISYRGLNFGSGNPFLYCDNFISKMKTVPSTWPVLQKSITPGDFTADFSVGFSGNVWEHMKQYASVYQVDINYRNGLLTFEPRQKDVKVGASLSQLSVQIQDREKARNVEVVNQQHTATTNTPKVLWKADQVYQVAVGEVQEFTIQTPHSIADVNSPICVSGITPYPYTSGTGQYVVTGSDGYIVSPSFWSDQGGKITCDITGVEGEIKVRIKGPDFDSPRAPYRISEGDAGRPALYVTGQGVMADPKTMKVPTGNAKAAKDVGTTVDSPFISNTKQAYDAAARASKQFATPDVSVAFAEPTGYDEVSKLGIVPAGSLLKHQGAIVRVTDVTQTPSSESGTAVLHNTIYQYKRSYGAGATIADVNAYNAGKPIGKVNLKPMKVIQ